MNCGEFFLRSNHFSGSYLQCLNKHFTFRNPFISRVLTPQLKMAEIQGMLITHKIQLLEYLEIKQEERGRRGGEWKRRKSRREQKKKEKREERREKNEEKRRERGRRILFPQ